MTHAPCTRLSFQMLFFKTAIKVTGKKKEEAAESTAVQQRGRDGHGLEFQQCPSGAHQHSAIPDVSCVPHPFGSPHGSPGACSLPVEPGERCGAEGESQPCMDAPGPRNMECWWHPVWFGVSCYPGKGPEHCGCCPLPPSPWGGKGQLLGDLICAGVCNKHMTDISVADGNV